MTKAIIFDLGGVLIDVSTLIKKTVKILGPSDPHQFWQDLNKLAVDWSKGKSNGLKFVRELALSYQKGAKVDELRKIWLDDFQKNISINEEIVEIVKRLRKRYKVALLSNMNKTHDKVVGKMGIYDLFDEVVLSYQVGMSKDKPEIFRLMASKISVKENQCVFIDDTKLFVQTAAAVGMKTIRYDNPGQVKKELESLKVKVD